MVQVSDGLLPRSVKRFPVVLVDDCVPTPLSQTMCYLCDWALPLEEPYGQKRLGFWFKV